MKMFGSDERNDNDLYDRSIMYRSEDKRPDDSPVIRHFSDDSGYDPDSPYEGTRHFSDD